MVRSRLEFVFPHPCQPDLRRGSNRDLRAQALSVSSTAQSHPWSLQLLPWAPELTAGNVNISEVSHIFCSPSRELHTLLLPPPTPLLSGGTLGPLYHTPLLGSLQILHFHMKLSQFCSALQKMVPFWHKLSPHFNSVTFKSLC